MACFAILFALLSVAASHKHGSHNSSPAATVTANCSADITVNSTEPSTAFYIYNDIMVENTGLCDITRVFVNITFPPEDIAFAYYNVSNQTGELLGFASPMPQGSVQLGGTVVLNSARIPSVVLSTLECSDTCNVPSQPDGIPSSTLPTDSPVSPTDAPSGSSSAESSSAESSSAESSSAESSSDETSSDETSSESSSDSSSELQVEIKRGSNHYWFGLNVLSGGEVMGPRKVQFRDSSSDASWLRMDVAQWGDAPTFTYSPTSGPLVLPISLRITTTSRQVTVLSDIITSFSPSVYSSQPTQAASADDEGDDVDNL